MAWGGEAFLGNIVPNWQAVAENVHEGEIKQCGHFIAEENPEFTIRQTLDFFSQLQNRS